MRLERTGLLAIVLLLSLLPLKTRPTAASGCGLQPMPNPHDRLSMAIENWSDLVLIGVVTAEVRVEPDYDTPELTDLKRSLDQNVHDDYSIFRSTVRPEVVLKGEAPQGDLDLPWLSEVWQCAGGPRLHPGERVLLFLKLWPTWTKDSIPHGFIWQTATIGGLVQLRNGEALMNDYQSRSQPQTLSSVEDLIKQLGPRLGTPPESASLAIEVSRRPDPKSRAHQAEGSTAVSAALIALVFAVSLAARRHRGQ